MRYWWEHRKKSRAAQRAARCKPVIPWGPFCYLTAEPHPAPFNKSARARQRRAEKRFKLQQQLKGIQDETHPDTCDR